jgi:WD40 repeat protein
VRFTDNGNLWLPLTAVGAMPGVAPHRSLLAGSGEIWSVAYSPPDGRLLATAGEDGLVRLWEADSLQLFLDIRAHTDQVRSIAFSRDGSMLCSTGFDCAIRIWDTATGALRSEMHDTCVAFYPCFTPDGTTLITGSEETSPRVWDVATGALRSRLEDGHSSRAWGGDLSPDGSLIASCARDGTVCLWEAESGTLLRRLPGHSAAATAAVFSPDGATLATCGSDRIVRMWDVATGALSLAIGGHSDLILDIVFSPDGALFASVTRDHQTRLWEARTGYFLRSLRGGAYGLAFSPDGAVLASSGDDGRVELYGISRALQSRKGAVDLTRAFTDWGLPPRGQGVRATCTVFAVAGCVEYALARRTGTGVPVSAEYLNWAASQVVADPEAKGHFLASLVKAFSVHGACPERDMPYQPIHDSSIVPSEQARTHAREVRDAGLIVHWINPWAPDCRITQQQLGEIRDVLASGYPVAAGSFHSALLVGYLDDPEMPGGGSFLVRDSAGPGSYEEMSYEEALGRIGDALWME